MGFALAIQLANPAWADVSYHSAQTGNPPQQRQAETKQKWLTRFASELCRMVQAVVLWTKLMRNTERLGGVGLSWVLSCFELRLNLG